jgi:hypothetical protein
MQAWAAPDPAAPVTANLAAGVELAVAERRGAWARVVATNGWSGWVDGRLLVEKGASAWAAPAQPTAAAGAATAQPAGGSKYEVALTRPIATAGAVAVAVATFLPWLSNAGFSANGFDVPFMFLIDPGGIHSDTFSVGIVTLALGVLGVAATLLRGFARWTRPIGAFAIGLGVLYLVQLWRQASDTGLGFMDIVGAAPFAAVAGGVLLLLKR